MKDRMTDPVDRVVKTCALYFSVPCALYGTILSAGDL